MSCLRRHFPVLAALLAMPALCQAAAPTDIVRVLGQFVQAGHATNKCATPAAETVARHDRNFRIVTQRATEEMQRRKPEASRQQIADTFASGETAVRNRIDEIIRSKGCSDPGIQDLLLRYHTQADMTW